ncbi:hypothetical protein PsorP6_015548 [Peronosclerospora sorghi]|uniref:Uncharacterized protein n=1 Tax=Peronosclerospora sorghi TaxID=230839 RepID=A0ACC0WN04_9STRA|nr:hypothetical protein PsorP6_015548 [Peronosclerospora sorghi]
MVRSSALSAVAFYTALVSSTWALNQKLHGLNYDLRQAPDWDPNRCKSADAIAADLKILSSITSNVRTYSLSDCDVSSVLKTAKSLSLTVWLGVWVSEDPKVYDAEVKAFKQLMSAGLIDSNVVGINVGSEAVYRKDITAQQAIKYATDFKKVMSDHDLKIPVSITDIVDTFIQYPDMLKVGNIVTINQFPFWEKIDAHKAAAQFNKRIQPLLKMAGDMEVVVSETGWPTAGFAANASVASEENAAIYLNDFYQLAKSKGWKYYYFAAYDTPHKEKQEDDASTVESHFGIFNEKGVMKAAYKNLTFTKNGDISSSNDSATLASSGSLATSNDTDTLSPVNGNADSTRSDRSKTDSKAPTDANAKHSASSQLVTASFALGLSLVSTVFWIL